MWPHLFIHSLGNIPQAWYLEEELKCQTTNWDVLSTQFCRDFYFSNVDQRIAQALRAIRGVLFSGVDILEECNMYVYFAHQYESGFHDVVCSKINKDTDDDLEELKHFSFK